MLSRSYGVMCFHVGRLLDSGTVAPSFRDLVTFVESHGIAPVVGHEFALEEIGEAGGLTVGDVIRARQNQETKH